MMVVPDATRDPRFADNPLVTGAPGIRFYAGVPLRGVDGVNLGTLCIIDVKPRDLSESQRSLFQDLAEIAMDELRLRLTLLEQSQLATAIANVECGVLIADPNQPDHPIVYCNPAFTKITGYSLEEIAGRNCRFLSGEATDRAERRVIRDAIADRRPYRGLVLNYRKNGEPFWNDLTISPVFDPEERLVGYVGLQDDVTQRREAEIRLQESYDKLRALESQRDNLTHMVVHDLRSPLTVLMGFLGVLDLRTEEKLDGEERQALEYCLEAGRKLNTMVTSLLDVSRLESGEMPLEPVACELAGLTRQALRDRLALPDGDRLQLSLPAEPVVAWCDSNLTTRIITNLVGNALKFTPPPGGVSVCVEQTAEGVRCAVSDQGPGIHPDYHASIFQKFGQVAGSRGEHSTGLGLAFCKLAVEAQGGHLGVESALGAGSTFWFTLPAMAVATSGAAHALGHPPRQSDVRTTLHAQGPIRL